MSSKIMNTVISVKNILDRAIVCWHSLTVALAACTAAGLALWIAGLTGSDVTRANAVSDNAGGYEQ